MDLKDLKQLFSGFEDRDLERRFIRKLHDPADIRIIIAAGSSMYLLFLFVDYNIYREYFFSLLIMRCGVFLPIMAVINTLTHLKSYEKISSILLAAIALTASGGIIAMEYIVRESEFADLVFFGLFLVIFFFNGTGKVRIIYSLITGTAILAPAVFVDSVFVETAPERVVMKVFYIISMALIGILTTAVIQSSVRNNFLKQLKIEEMSMTDPLTGLRNRLFFQKLIQPELEDYMFIPEDGDHRKGRDPDNPERCCYGIILMDVDHFKKINDRYGHEAGDRFLVEFSRRVEKEIRTADALIRWGGEEFLLLLRNMDREALGSLAERIRLSVSEKPFDLKTEMVSATISGGTTEISA